MTNKVLQSNARYNNHNFHPISSICGEHTLPRKAWLLYNCHFPRVLDGASKGVNFMETKRWCADECAGHKPPSPISVRRLEHPFWHNPVPNLYQALPDVTVGRSTRYVDWKDDIQLNKMRRFDTTTLFVAVQIFITIQYSTVVLWAGLSVQSRLWTFWYSHYFPILFWEIAYMESSMLGTFSNHLYSMWKILFDSFGGIIYDCYFIFSRPEIVCIFRILLPYASLLRDSNESIFLTRLGIFPGPTCSTAARIMSLGALEMDS